MSNRIALLAMIAIGASSPTARAQPQPIPTIIDTDIGSDVDDAFALAFALASRDFDIRGITTVGEQAEDRAWIVCRLLGHGGIKPIPVAFGHEPQPKGPIDWQIQYRRHPAPIFNRTQRPDKLSATEWMYKNLKDNPAKATILALGPLTNIARLLKDHPDAAKHIERIVLMGGSFRVGYDGKPQPEPEWNIKGDIPAAQAVFRSGLPLTVVPLDATATRQATKADRDRLFGAYTPLTLQVQTLYELWDKETPVLFDPIAAIAVLGDRFFEFEPAHVVVDDKGMTRFGNGPANTRVAKASAPEIVGHIIETIRAKGETSLPAEPKNLSKLIERGGFPAKVHVAEDYDTDIEKRWWMTGKAETKDVPPGGVRAQRGVLTQDFDDRQGNMKTSYRAVVFNPVPGPPMGKNTRLTFRYKLIGTDHLRVQLYSLSNGYHRYLSVKGVPQNEWRTGTVDMTQMRRPDGTGGPLSENERIDDIQFYVDPRAEVLIDDVVLYDAAAEGEKRPFPERILYTGWFDTGKHGKEWLGDFEVVAHEKPRHWKAARSVPQNDGKPWIRLDFKGERRVGTATEAAFKYHLAGGDRLRVELRHKKTGKTWSQDLTKLATGGWSEGTARFTIPAAAAGKIHADELRFLPPPGATLTIDEVLLYVAP
jgi:purine nucleosidase